MTAEIADEALAREVIDILTNDSENPGRMLRHLTDDCVWVINPGDMRYRGIDEIHTFIEVALAMRGTPPARTEGAAAGTSVTLTDSFWGAGRLCVEYAHAFSFGKRIPGLGKRAGVTEMRHCNVYRFQDGKIAEIHEYAVSSLWWLNLATQVILRRVWKRTQRRLRTG